MGDESDPEALLKLLRRLCDGNEFIHKADFVDSVLWCLRTIVEQENDEVVEDAAKVFIQLYDRSIPLIQNQLIHGIINNYSGFLTLLLCNRSLSTGSSFPRHLILDTFFSTNLTTRLRESYVMCKGTNSSFNLGVASNGEVKEPRLVPFPEKIQKVSMSNTHTLFLTESGTVYGCGKGTNGQLGPDLKKLVVEPVLLKIGQGKTPIVDLVASEKYSVFITSRSVFVCGEVSHSSIGSTSDRPIRRFDDLDPIHPNFNAVSASSDRVIVSNNNSDWLAGLDLNSNSVHSTFACLKNSLHNVVRRPDRCFVFDSGVTNLRSTPQIIFGCSVSVPHLTSSPVQRFVKSRCSRLVRFPWGRWEGPAAVTAELTLLSDIPGEEQLPGSVGFLRSVFNCPGLPESNCVFSVNGTLTRLNVIQFDATSDGDVVLLAFSLENLDSIISADVQPYRFDEDFMDIHNLLLKHYSGACLYRGKAKLVADSSEEDDFKLFTTSQDIKMFYRMRVVLQLEEIPGTHGVRQFVMSPNGKNLIYIVDNDEMSVQAVACVDASSNPLGTFGVPSTEMMEAVEKHVFNTKFHYNWAVLDVAQLNSVRESHGYEPVEFDLLVKPSKKEIPRASNRDEDTAGLLQEDTSFHMVSEFAKARFPRLDDFIEDGVFLEEKILYSAHVCSLILNYLEGKVNYRPRAGVFKSNLMEVRVEHPNYATFFNATRKALNCLGLDLINENYDLWRVRSLEPDRSVEFLSKDVNIRSSDGEVIPFNRRLLTLHSNYFEAALMHRQEDSALKIDFPANVVKSALQILVDPLHLYDIDYSQIFHLLNLFDQYIFEAAIDDCLWVLADRANEFNISLFFDCYQNLEHLRDMVVDLLFERLHLVCFWRSSATAPLQLLRQLSAKLEPSICRLFSSNGVANGGNLIHGVLSDSPPDASWTCVTKEDLQKLLLGESPDEVAIKHLDLLYKKAEQKRLDEDSDNHPLYLPPLEQDDSYLEKPRLIIQILKGKHTRTRRASESAKDGNFPVVSSPVPEREALVVEEENVVDEVLESSFSCKNGNDEEKEQPANEEKMPETPLSPHFEPCCSPINRWGVTGASPAAGDSPFHIQVEMPKKPSEKFIAKGKKFKKVDLNTPPKVSIAPWLAASSSTTSSPLSLRDIQREEQETAKSAPRNIPRTPRTRKNTWNGEPSPSPQQAPVSLAMIMAEEEIMNAPVVRTSRPLEYVEAEEKAVQELSRLYEHQYNETAMVTVEVVSSTPTTSRWGGGRLR